MKNRNYLEISLSALRHNVLEIKRHLHPDTKIMGITKANGYGCGGVEISQEMEKLGVDFFAVATLQEALEFRNAGIQSDILILGHTSESDYFLLEKYNLIQSVFSLSQAQKLAQFKIRTHLKIDTGMSRMGFVYHTTNDNLTDIEHSLAILNYNEGIFTHFACSDSDEKSDRQFTQQQIELFESAVEKLSKTYHFKYKHIQNSYGIINYPHLKYDFVRPGVILFGHATPTMLEKEKMWQLKPVVTWKCRVGLVKYVDTGDTISYSRTYQVNQLKKVATITCGYADGYPRQLSNRGYVLINGQRCKILGRVCMDQMVVDVSDVDVKVDDEVVLIGKSKNQEITLQEFATWNNTIVNEILCRFSQRVERIYYD